MRSAQRVPRLPGAASLWALEVLLRTISRRYGALQWFLEVMPPGPADRFSAARALRAARDAARDVPAYRDFLRGAGVDPDRIRSLAQLPETDKKSYIDRYPLPERCVGGRLPLVGTTIDESSGSTGTPYNWARSAEERRHVRRMVAFFARYTFGDAPLVVLNTFSMGAWATGMTTAAALEQRGLVKATGPDIDKVLSTMAELGPGYRYLLVGYPPFLKVIVDEAERRGMEWSAYHVDALLGGEGNSEALRDYLLRRFASVYSGYGVTDVEIGLAAETPISIALRRLARERSDVAEALFGEADRSPMVFQFNPFFHHIEVNERRELLFTVARHATLSPKIRYNPHDEGGVLRDDELRARLASVGVRLEDVNPPGARRLIRMPYLSVFGRKDSTVSVMGANIYPEDIDAAIYGEPEVAQRILSYQLSVVEGQPGETRPHVAIQLLRDDPDDAFRDRLATLLTESLRTMNRDYREAIGEYPALLPFIVELHRRGEGPFAGSEKRIKFRYIAAESATH
jgi:phenylacetate-coenzyme A ligase PaaK-like adenylate-forming protein